MRLSIACLIACGLWSADAPAGSATAPARPDPTMAVVAEGRFIYRQRDIDALLLVAKRHAGRQWQASDEPAAAAAIAACLREREDFLLAIANLPASLRERARDALVLDLLAYTADSSTRAPAVTQQPASIPAAGPVVVRLPQPLLRRQVAGRTRSLAVGVALTFPSEAAAVAHEGRVAVFQDELLGILTRLNDADFTTPSHTVLKEAIERAFRDKVPSLPAGSVLIPVLDARDETP